MTTGTQTNIKFFKLTPPPILIVIMAVTMVFFFLISLIRHSLFRSTGFDLGIYDQVIYLISQGLTPLSSILGFHHLGNHAAWAVYPLALLYKIYPSVCWLFFVQAIFLTLGAWPVWGLARLANLSEKSSITLALVYLLYPVIFNVNLFDFHPEVMSIPILIWAILAAKLDKIFWFILAIIWVLGGKAVLSLTVIATGFWLLIEKRRIYGIISIALGTAWFFIATQLIIPSFSGSEAAGVWRYSYLGKSVLEIAINLILKPYLILGKIFSFDTFKYLFSLIIPVIWAFLPIPGTHFNYRYFLPLIAAIPALSLNILADFPFQRSLAYQYSLPIVPFLLIVVINRLVAINQIDEQQLFKQISGKIEIIFNWIKKHSARSIIIWSLIIFPWIAEEHNFIEYFQTLDTWRSTLIAINQIPNQGAVLTDNYLAPQLSHRQNIKLLSQFQPGNDLAEFDYILLNLRHPWPDTTAIGQGLAAHLKKNQKFSVKYNFDDVLLFKKNPEIIQ